MYHSICDCNDVCVYVCMFTSCMMFSNRPPVLLLPLSYFYKFLIFHSKNIHRKRHCFLWFCHICSVMQDRFFVCRYFDAFVAFVAVIMASYNYNNIKFLNVYVQIFLASFKSIIVAYSLNPNQLASTNQIIFLRFHRSSEAALRL